MLDRGSYLDGYRGCYSEKKLVCMREKVGFGFLGYFVLLYFGETGVGKH
jgi:hypothetical protein